MRCIFAALISDFQELNVNYEQKSRYKDEINKRKSIVFFYLISFLWEQQKKSLTSFFDKPSFILFDYFVTPP